MGPVPYVLHVHAHKHSFDQSHACYEVAASSCGFRPSVPTVVLYVLAAGVVAACVFLLLQFCFFLSLFTYRWFSTWIPHRGGGMSSVWFLQV